MAALKASGHIPDDDKALAVSLDPGSSLEVLIKTEQSPLIDILGEDPFFIQIRGTGITRQQAKSNPASAIQALIDDAKTPVIGNPYHIIFKN